MARIARGGVPARRPAGARNRAGRSGVRADRGHGGDRPERNCADEPARTRARSSAGCRRCSASPVRQLSGRSASACRGHSQSRGPLQPLDFACPRSSKPVPTFERHALSHRLPGRRPRALSGRASGASAVGGAAHRPAMRQRHGLSLRPQAQDRRPGQRWLRQDRQGSGLASHPKPTCGFWRETATGPADSGERRPPAVRRAPAMPPDGSRGRRRRRGLRRSRCEARRGRRARRRSRAGRRWPGPPRPARSCG